jgi:hypothetical protein
MADDGGDDSDEDFFKATRKTTMEPIDEGTPALNTQLERKEQPPPNPPPPLALTQLRGFNPPPPSEQGGLDTVRTMRTARAVRALPPREREAREKSLQKLGELSLEEKLRLFKRVHAAKKTIAQRVTDVLVKSSTSGGSGGSDGHEISEEENDLGSSNRGWGSSSSSVRTPNRPKTPREVEEEVEAVGRQVLDDVVAAERKEEQLVVALRRKMAEAKNNPTKGHHHQPKGHHHPKEGHHHHATGGPAKGGSDGTTATAAVSRPTTKKDEGATPKAAAVQKPRAGSGLLGKFLSR